MIFTVMSKRRWLYTWGIFIACWIISSTLFLSLLPPILVRNDAESDKCRLIRQTNLQGNNHTFINTSDAVTTHSSNDVFSYEKYGIEQKKLLQLDAMLKKIMTVHSRPDDEYFCFNVTRSDEISVTRDVPDLRPAECKNVKFNYSSLPTVSMVTPFHNEALTPLLRHVHAILARTPPRLLLEIILVDDNSNFTFLGKDLDEYFRILDPKIQIVRNMERKGLVLSRMIGTDLAKGEVIIMLDAHMEVCEGWLEPLLDRINSHGAIVVQPGIVTINDNQLSLHTDEVTSSRGGFGWDMGYRWLELPDYLHQTRDTNWGPVPFPILQGSCIAVRKSYFYSIGRFDPGLEIWGGEHFDLSFNVWMTGGRIEAIPCSKVGHLFKNFKYSFGSEDRSYIMAKNNLRIVETWMDDYRSIARASMSAVKNPLPVFSEAELQSLMDRRKNRERRQSKSFDWFLRNIMPEQTIPDVNDLFFGGIKQRIKNECFYVMPDGFVGITACSFAYIIPKLTFALDKFGKLRYEAKCVRVDEKTNVLKIQECLQCKGENITSPYWSMDKNHLFYHDHSGTMCATATKTSLYGDKVVKVVTLQACGTSELKQDWMFMYQLTWS